MWYRYSQNNSHGRWELDTGKVVWIEADTPEEADAVAKTLGIYFNGVGRGIDCYCCGDRWTSQADYTDAFPDVKSMMKYSNGADRYAYPHVAFYPKED